MSDQPLRLQRFNAICALLFERLYDNFPIGTDLEFADIAEEVPSIDDLEASDIWEFEEVFIQTLHWLEEEGLVRIRVKTSSGSFHDMRLTMSGFAVLRSVPDAVDESPKQPVIDEVKQALGRGGAVVSQESLRQVVGSVFRATLGA